MKLVTAEMYVKERVTHVVKRDNHWIALAFSELPGERGVIVYERSNGMKRWQKRHPPSGITAGKIWGGWDFQILQDDTILLASNFGSARSQLLRSRPYSISIDLHDLFGALSPDTVDLGTPPKTPMGEVAEAVSKLTQASAELIRKKTD